MHSQLLPFVELPPGCEKRDDFGRKIINLDLGIGSSADATERNKEIKQEKKEPLFTAAQFHELHNQILVYNFIALGLPVAFHLLLPSWISVFNSLGSAIYKKYPSFAEFKPCKSDCSTPMDLEPGRCRRTDGRKWRCSKSVVPLQKYCERHMHRGRQCSRKHVEPIKNVSRPNDITSTHNKMPSMSIVTPELDHKIPMSSSFQSDVGPTPPYSNYGIGVPAFVKFRGDEKCDTKQATAHVVTVAVGDEINKNINVGYTTSSSSNSMSNFATNEGNHAEGKSSSNEGNPRRTKSWKHGGARNSNAGFVSSRFGLSPKSVLPRAAGKVNQGLGNMETEPQRCRRTDGKKWRCKRGVLPNQKYCESHMHRGAKKRVSSPQSLNTSLDREKNLDNGINLNTVPTSPQHSSMSDATTITN